MHIHVFTYAYENTLMQAHTYPYAHMRSDLRQQISKCQTNVTTVIVITTVHKPNVPTQTTLSARPTPAQRRYCRPHVWHTPAQPSGLSGQLRIDKLHWKWQQTNDNSCVEGSPLRQEPLSWVSLWRGYKLSNAPSPDF